MEKPEFASLVSLPHILPVISSRLYRDSFLRIPSIICTDPLLWDHPLHVTTPPSDSVTTPVSDSITTPLSGSGCAESPFPSWSTVSSISQTLTCALPSASADLFSAAMLKWTVGRSASKDSGGQEDRAGLLSDVSSESSSMSSSDLAPSQLRINKILKVRMHA